MRVMFFFTQLWVAAFVVFAGSAFVSLGFEFQGGLFELVYWSAAAAAVGAIGYAILSKMFSAAFGLVSLGTSWRIPAWCCRGSGSAVCFADHRAYSASASRSLECTDAWCNRLRFGGCG